MADVVRIDYGTVSNIRRTPQGGLDVDARIAKAGVLRYRDDKGNEWGELVPPEELFKPESLATLRNAPVTVNHPPSLVTPANYSQVARGHVSDMPREDAGRYVAAPIVVQDAAAIEAIERGDLRDISAGYTCEIDPTPGTYEGVPYQQVQRNRRYNHAAILAPGAGRAGTDVGLRMDGMAVEVREDAKEKTTPAPGDGTRADAREEPKAMKFKVAGKEFEVRTDADAPPMQAAIDETVSTLTQEAAAAKAASLDAYKKIAALEATISMHESTEEQTGAPVTEDMIPEEVLDSALAKREKIRADARAILGDEVFGEKGALKSAKPEAIRAAVLAKIAPSVKLDAKDAKGVAVFDAKMQGALYDAAVTAYLAAKPPQKRADGLDAVRDIVSGPPPAKGERQDSDADDGSAEWAKRKAERDALERGRRPLNGSK
jgi:hypothetical protein